MLNTVPPPGYNRDAPLLETEPVDNCPLCSGTQFSPYTAGYDYELETCSNEWNFMRCTDCSCVWLNPRPAAKELSVVYPPSYYSYTMSDKVNPIALSAKKILDKNKFNAIIKACGGVPASFLDIGCGDGRYLHFFQDLGVPQANIYGLELSDEAVTRLRSRGFQAFNERVEDAVSIPTEGIGLATMFHVIEHVAEPVRVLQKIRTWLSADGVLALETPNLAAWDARLFKDKWWGGYHIPRHWTLFNDKTLTEILNKAGFELIALKYQTGHSFWMYSLHHKLKYNEKTPRPVLAKQFDPLANIFPLAAFTAFDIMRRTLGFPTSAIMAIARKI